MVLPDDNYNQMDFALTFLLCCVFGHDWSKAIKGFVTSNPAEFALISPNLPGHIVYDKVFAYSAIYGGPEVSIFSPHVVA